jgi:ABC-type antimicrobial peptide transport system permease subunit
MSPLNYITASLRQHRRTHLAVAAGVAVATAVITGALLVGDSVRGSLRDLVLERLGTIDSVLVAEQPFRAQLANEITEQHLSASRIGFETIAPLLLIPGSMSASSSGRTEQATQLTILGVTDEFWKLGDEAIPELAGNEAIITQAIANELHAEVGDEVILRVAVPSNIPADSTLGEKADSTTVRRLTVKAIANEGIVRFGLQPSQLEPRNVFVPLATLQRLLEIPGKANVLAVKNEISAMRHVVSRLKPTLADFGLQVTEFKSGGATYVQLSAERLVLPEHVVELAKDLFSGPRGQTPRLAPQAVITYLANTINLGDKQVPYSTVTGINSTQELGPLRGENGEPVLLTDNEIALNDWTAARLGAKIGDTVALKYYEPETTHGELVERTTEPLIVKLIVPLKDAAGNPTAAADEHFTPELPGVTDERSISDWDLPFQLVEKISREDEDYWDKYRTTPKAFMSLARADRLWSTRWGTISALRWPASDGITAKSVTAKLTEKIDPSALGMKWISLREQGLAAARGTTSFEGLFLGFSFFLMASAVMLIALLFRLGAESRAAEVGVLAAVGWSPQRVRRLWLAEAAMVAIAGAIVGAFAGVAYAGLMIFGLTTWWVAAVVTPFLRLHVNPMSITLGAAIGVIVSLITIWWSLRKFTKLAPRQLLAGDTNDPQALAQLARKPKRPWLPVGLIFASIAVGLGAMFAGLRDEAQAGAFFGSGALVLTAMMIWLRGKLRQPAITRPSALTLSGLAMRNARRKPTRTLLSVGLAAVASFLIVALSAFRLVPTEGGTGGYDLIATSDLSVYFDLNTPEGRRELGFSSDDEKSLAGVTVASFRVRGGEDASCLNLYQTSQPRVVGVPNEFGGGQFAWAGVSIPRESKDPPRLNPKNTTGKGNSIWKVLDTVIDESVIPIVLDKNTAAYSLHLSGIGSRFTIRNAFDQEVTLEVVGLLAGSVLQGNVLMSEANFLRLFPDSSGRKLFLIRNESKDLSNDKLASLLETRLVDNGFDAVSATARLAEFMAVQNTYLSTFQSLGALGLLMGTVGLAIAQLRSVIERRGELALLRSVGFNRRRLAEMVLSENVSILFAGLGSGILAALVATLPHWAFAGADMPWGTLAMLLVIVALCGIDAGWLAVRVVVRAQLVTTLRGD